MANVIDELIVLLKLDNAQFNAEQKKAAEAFIKTRDQAGRTARDIETSGKRAAGTFSQIRNEALSLITVLLGGKGVLSFAQQATTQLAALGREAVNIGISPQNLNAFQLAVQRNGGTAEGATASFKNLATAMQQLKTTGTTASLPWLRTIGADLADSPLDLFMKFTRFVEANKGNGPLINQVGGGLGLDPGAIQEAMRGYQQVQKDLQESSAKFSPSDADITNVTHLQRAFINLEQTIEGIGDKILAYIAKPVSEALDRVDAFVEAHPVAGTAALAGGGVGSGILGVLGLRGLYRWLTSKGAGEAAEAGIFSRIFGAVFGTFLRRILGPLALLIPSDTIASDDTTELDKRFPNRPRGTPTTVPPADTTESWWKRTMPTWLGGDPASTPVPQTSAGGSGTSGRIVSQLMSYGWTAAQAAGLAANVQRESNFNPALVGDGGLAYGIGQWHPDRQAAFAKWAGHDIRSSTFEEQVAFINQELTAGAEKAAGARLRAAGTAAEAGDVASRYYERPRDTEGEAARRAALATLIASVTRTPNRQGGYDSAKDDAVFDALWRGSLTPDSDLRGPSAADRWGSSVTNANSTTAGDTHIHVGSVTVQTQAKDARGVARGLGGALNDLVVQANTGLA